MRTDLAVTPQSWFVEPDTAAKLSYPDGLSYLGATGVAMRQLAGIPTHIPAFSLTPRSRDDGRLQDVRRRLIFALAASIVSLFVGIFISFNVGLRANMVEAELKRSNEVVGWPAAH